MQHYLTHQSQVFSVTVACSYISGLYLLHTYSVDLMQKHKPALDLKKKKKFNAMIYFMHHVKLRKNICMLFNLTKIAGMTICLVEQ